MSALTNQESNWLAQLSNRLRLIQADTSAAPAKQRREFLAEEIARNLKPLPPESRKRYLEALLARFPVAGQIVKSTAATPVVAPPAPAPETFEQQLEKLIERARDVTPEQREAAVQRLADAGLALTQRAETVLEVPDEMRKALGLADDEQPRLENLAQLCALLVDTFHRLDQTALATLREMSQRCPLLKRPQDFRRAAAQYLTGVEPNIDAQVRVVSSLLGLMLAAILGAGKDFGRQYVERLSPAAIQSVVISQLGEGPLGGRRRKECWDKYELLAKDFETAELVDHKIKECLVAFIERKALSGR